MRRACRLRRSTAFTAGRTFTVPGGTRLPPRQSTACGYRVRIVRRLWTTSCGSATGLADCRPAPPGMAGENLVVTAYGPVPWSAFVRRVSVVGNSGSGKSTLARELAAVLGGPHLELDGVFHQPRWEPLPLDEFQQVAAAWAAEGGWVTDGNYSGRVQPLDLRPPHQPGRCRERARTAPATSLFKRELRAAKGCRDSRCFHVANGSAMILNLFIAGNGFTRYNAKKSSWSCSELPNPWRLERISQESGHAGRCRGGRAAGEATCRVPEGPGMGGEGPGVETDCQVPKEVAAGGGLGGY